MKNNNTRTRKGRPVKCIETNEIFASAVEAAKAFGCSHDLVGLNCRGTIKSAKGMHFTYINKPDMVININGEANIPEFKRNIVIQKESIVEANGSRDNGNCKSVLCITDGKAFSSMADAAEYYGIGQSQISYACKEKGRTADGKQFCKFSDLYLYINEINDAINKKNAYYTLVEKENKRKELISNVNKCEETVRSIEVMLADAKSDLDAAKAELENFDC